jgi:hypothetical protein
MPQKTCGSKSAQLSRLEAAKSKSGLQQEVFADLTCTITCTAALAASG